MSEQVNPIFAGWYGRGGPGSGPGSTPEVTLGWRTFLTGFMKRNNVKSVLDFGCGDWQFSRMIDWTGIDYLGVDVVPAPIEQNLRVHARPGVRFKLVQPRDPIPAVDLIIAKDVLQHLSNADLIELLPRLRAKARHLLLVNDLHRHPDLDNRDIPTGGWRGLNLAAPPFNVPGKEVFTLMATDPFKVCYHVVGDLVESPTPKVEAYDPAKVEIHDEPSLGSAEDQKAFNQALAGAVTKEGAQ